MFSLPTLGRNNTDTSTSSQSVQNTEYPKDLEDSRAVLHDVQQFMDHNHWVKPHHKKRFLMSDMESIRTGASQPSGKEEMAKNLGFSG
ncbi:hypothetical protein FRB95_001265 [Tulasnella sp. JGI-2019a]|nr:hypothetical protein FRB95_001265 [Tulasnella sp. JGI-2019a]